MKATKRLASAGLVAAALLSGWQTPAVAFDPIDYPGANPTIHLQVIGTWRGGMFSTQGLETPPAYDPRRNLLFVGSAIRRQIDVLEIGDPYHPEHDFSIELGAPPSAVAFMDDVLAVSVHGPTKSSPGIVLFFDEDGDPEAFPVSVGEQPSMIAFTPNGRRIVVANTGEASDDYGEDPEGSVNLIRLRKTFFGIEPEVEHINFRDFNGRLEELRAAGVRIYGPGASVAQDLEPESVTVSADGHTAWITLERNNAIAVVDLEAEQVTSILPLGFKRNLEPGNGFDASDVDGRINIRGWPVRMWYQPDLLAAFQVGADTFLAMANEGDPRDFSGYSEVRRVRDLTLDPARFPNAAFLEQDQNLGRLNVSAVDGDPDGDGRYQALYAFGGRSFSVRSATGQLVFDSGSEFERIIAAAVPAFFNTTDDANLFDGRSDSRGPEPEGLAVGQIGARQYTFVAFERIGGVMVYDVTNPAAPRFEQYINNRNFAVDPAAVCVKDQPQSPECAMAGDLSPEGVLFISAADSPIGVPLLVLTHETSDSVTIFRIDQLVP